MTATLERQKFYTVDEANARIPLLQSILRDVTELSHEAKGLHERLILLQATGAASVDEEREIVRLARELDERQARMQGYLGELAQLGAVLKDDFLGLVDFPASLDGREVCLCYKLGEPEVGFWHEVDAGFSGRRPIKADSVSTSRLRGSR